MSGSTTIQHSNTSYEPNSGMEMSWKCVPKVDSTHDDDDTNSHMSAIPLQLPATANDSSNNSVLVTCSQAEGDLMRMFTVSNRHQIRRMQILGNYSFLVHTPQRVPAVLETQETVHLVRQRAQEALNNHRETARRVLLHQQREVLAATHQYEAAAKRNLVSALARNTETHNYYLQIQVRQLDHEVNARFSQRQREPSSRFSQQANQALEDHREILATEVISQVRERDEQVYDLRTESSSTTLGRRCATTYSRIR